MILSLDDIGKKEFISQIKKFNKLNDTNSNWFDNSKSSVINTIDDYLYWTIITENDKVIAFAAIDHKRFKIQSL